MQKQTDQDSKIQCTLTRDAFNVSAPNATSPNPKLLKVLEMVAAAGEQPISISQGSANEVISLCQTSLLANPKIDVQVITPDPALKAKVEALGIAVFPTEPSPPSRQFRHS